MPPLGCLGTIRQRVWEGDALDRSGDQGVTTAQRASFEAMVLTGTKAVGAWQWASKVAAVSSPRSWVHSLLASRSLHQKLLRIWWVPEAHVIAASSLKSADSGQICKPRAGSFGRSFSAMAGCVARLAVAARLLLVFLRTSA